MFKKEINRAERIRQSHLKFQEEERNELSAFFDHKVQIKFEDDSYAEFRYPIVINSLEFI